MFEAFGVFMAVWPLIQHYGMMILVILAGVVFWKFSPIGKEIGMILAITMLFGGVAYTVGLNDGESYAQAKFQIELKQDIQKAEIAQKKYDDAQAKKAAAAAAAKARSRTTTRQVEPAPEPAPVPAPDPEPKKALPHLSIFGL